ncbi:MAG: thioredoxin domain-containing protein [Nitrospirales bacterium]
MVIRLNFKWMTFVVFLLSCSSCQSTQSSHNLASEHSASGGPSVIHWNEWNEDTFRVAQEEDKLILLDLTAVWCHACHVMDETTYVAPSIIDLLNTRYISIRVDTDQRPDIEARYRNGGWPTTSILLPSGEIVFQANFLDTEDLHEALLESESLYRQNKQKLLGQAAEIWAKVKEARQNRVRPTGAIDGAIVDQMAATIKQNFDEVHGGFRAAPKFFEPEALSFLFSRYHKTLDSKYKQMVLQTLGQQQKLIDPIWGGFYRYAEQADWTQPHFEKMLHLQAMNLSNYLEAYQVTKEDRYRMVVEDTLGYVRKFLVDEKGRGFFASQDADIKNVVDSRHIVMSGEEYFELSEVERLKVGMPYVDQTIYTGWNGLMIKSFLEVYQVQGGQQILEIALKSLNYLYLRRYEPGKGMAHREVDGQLQEFGLLGDQVLFTGALIEAALSTGDMTYIEKAEGLTRDFLTFLEDEQGGGLYDRPARAAAEGLLKFPHKSLKENLQAALLLSNLFYVTEDHFYRNAAKRILQYVLGVSGALPLGLAGMSIDRFLKYPVHIVVVGIREDENTMQLFQEGLQLYAPGKIVRLLDPDVHSLKIGEITFPRLKKATAYICTDTICSQPFHLAREFPLRYQELVGNMK